MQSRQHSQAEGNDQQRGAWLDTVTQLRWSFAEPVFTAWLLTQIDRILPSNNIFNTPIDNFPAHGTSSAFMNSIGSHRIHLDFGSESDMTRDDYYGVPYNIVPILAAALSVHAQSRVRSIPFRRRRRFSHNATALARR